MNDAPPRAAATPPAWWRSLQDDVGRFLRSPLEVDGGRFHSPREAAAALHPRVVDDGPGPGAAARLALYHEQYWMRLFHTLQQTFPRAARVTGYFAFNRLAAAHFATSPPRSADLADVGRGFFTRLQAVLDGVLVPDGRARAPHGVIDAWLPSLIDGGDDLDELDDEVRAARAILRTVNVPWSMLAQALALDEACRRAFEAPTDPPWAMTPEVIAGVRAARLGVRTAASFSLVRVDWPIEAAAAITPSLPENALANAAGADDGPDPPPPSTTRLRAPIHHVIVARDGGVAHGIVDPVFARLLLRMRHSRFDDAVRHIEQQFPPAALAHLQASFDGFAAGAADNGWWVGTTA
jgi:hypothetical protein